MEIDKTIYKPVNVYYFYDDKGDYRKKKREIYVYPFHTERLEKYHIHQAIDVLKYYPWIKEGRVFVKRQSNIKKLNIF